MVPGIWGENKVVWRSEFPYFCNLIIETFGNRNLYKFYVLNCSTLIIRQIFCFKKFLFLNYLGILENPLSLSNPFLNPLKTANKKQKVSDAFRGLKREHGDICLTHFIYNCNQLQDSVSDLWYGSDLVRYHVLWYFTLKIQLTIQNYIPFEKSIEVFWILKFRISLLNCY